MPKILYLIRCGDDTHQRDEQIVETLNSINNVVAYSIEDIKLHKTKYCIVATTELSNDLNRIRVEIRERIPGLEFDELRPEGEIEVS